VPGATHLVPLSVDQPRQFLLDQELSNYFGFNVKMVQAPCHTKGHVLYYVESTGDEDGEAQYTFNFNDDGFDPSNVSFEK